MSYVSQEQIARAREMDLLSYLQSCEPYELVPLGKDRYCTKTHDSLKISNGKWYWWSRGFGGVSALDYLIKVKGMTLPEAVVLLTGEETQHLGSSKRNSSRNDNKNKQKQNQHTTKLPSQKISSTNESLKPTAYMQGANEATGAANTQGTATDNPNRLVPFLLSPRAKDNKRVMAYLLSRGIDREILHYCLHNGLLYEEQVHHNAVFVGMDEEGTARYAMLRGTLSQKRFIQEVLGSNKAYSFRLFSKDAQADSVLNVFESAIDALSWATMLKQRNKPWQSVRYLSLGGVAQGSEQHIRQPIALQRLLNEQPPPRDIHLRLDNDAAGQVAAQAIYQWLAQAGYSVKIILPPKGKDYNDYLCLSQNKELSLRQK